MTVLKLENGSNEEYADLLSLVKAHPEIEEAVLVWTVYGYRSEVVEDDDDLVIEYEYEELDSEYSYIGSTVNLESFADGYGIWDDLTVGLKDGVLMGNHAQWNEEGDRFPESDYPDSKGCTHIRMVSVTLPSGKRFVITKPGDYR